MIKPSQTVPVGEELAALRAHTHQQVRDLRDKITQLGPDEVELILTGARSHNAWTDRPVTDETLRAIYDVVKMGPTSMNSSPARFVFVRSDEGREKLKKALKPTNVPKVVTAPVTVIIAHDLEFWKELLFLFPHEDHRPHYQRQAGLRGGDGVPQRHPAGRLFHDRRPRARARRRRHVGLFQQSHQRGVLRRHHASLEFPVNLGYADETALFHKLPRFDFDDVCSFA